MAELFSRIDQQAGVEKKRRSIIRFQIIRMPAEHLFINFSELKKI